MIVTLAAWLYIVQALLGLSSLFSGPFGLGGGTGNFATLLSSGVVGAMGYGLLKRESWGRWLALGVSLLSWTFGSLLLLGVLFVALASGKTGEFMSMMFSNGGLAIVAVILVVFLLVMVVSVVISFKLFFYLCSQEGCEEFNVPYDSAGTVVASIGAWIAMFFAQMFMASGGSGALALLAAQQMLARNHHDERRSTDTEGDRVEAERREYVRQREERARHAEQEAQVRAVRENEEQQQAVAASAAYVPSPAPSTSTATSEPAVDEAPAPTMTESVRDEKPDATRILKCRDASGAVTFTQGYCPPGTKRVEMPQSE